MQRNYQGGSHNYKNYNNSNTYYKEVSPNKQNQYNSNNNSSANRQQNLETNYYFPGAASLLDHLDQKIFLMLRDGKKLIGILRSFDQFANLVLESTIERIVVGKKFGDLPLGLYIVRGENVILMGEVNNTVEESQIQKGSLQPVSASEILELHRLEQEKNGNKPNPLLIEF